MTYAYLRVSTDRQDTDNQKHGILEFANERKLGTIEFVSETLSGKIPFRERQLGALVDRIGKGDVLIVSELSRLGRSMLEVMEILSIMAGKEAKVYAIKGQYELGDNIQSKVLAFAFSLAAEVERELLSARIKEALARRKAEGKPMGRRKGSTGKSKLDSEEDRIRELLSFKVSQAAIARILKCARPTLRAFIEKKKM